MPETMFNETKDELSQLVIENMNSMKKASGSKSTTEIPDQIHLLRRKAWQIIWSNIVILDHAHQDISYTLNQLQNKLLQKQFFILEEQQRNLEKEAKKLDLELLILKQRKDAQEVVDLP